MKKYTTEIRAFDPLTNEMKKWCGDYVEANSFEEAEEWCRLNKGYLKVNGELVAEIPCIEGTHKPDWDNMIDYEKD